MPDPATTLEAPLAVVGAGPAGLAAATTAARAGLSVVLVDAAGRPGGQYWRQRSDSQGSDDVPGSLGEGGRHDTVLLI